MVIATPGRLIDLLNKEKLTLAFCKLFCLDEGDRLLDGLFAVCEERGEFEGREGRVRRLKGRRRDLVLRGLGLAPRGRELRPERGGGGGEG